jgi:hypothetical protein
MKFMGGISKRVEVHGGFVKFPLPKRTWELFNYLLIISF